jgi:hypothetical protein
MGGVSDAFGHARYGFVLATGYAALLLGFTLVNSAFHPARRQLQARDASEYGDALR